LDEETLELIDELVRLGVFSSRSEALRELVRVGAESFAGFAKIIRAVERLFELEKEMGDIPVRLDGALRRLLEEREERL
jgi:Arc/MetJ-type ribon-helix-helix transcriptional regulator